MSKEIKLNDSGVLFDAATHTYTLNGKMLKGVTSGSLVERAFPDTYKKPENYTQEEWDAILDNAAKRGTNIHEAIQFCEENKLDSTIPEYMNYKSMKECAGLQYLAHEYIVTDGENYASPIDLVFTDVDGKIVIADIKTTYKPHYENVALQLSIYKRFFERQNPKLKVSQCVLIWLRGEKSEYRPLTTWADEALDYLIKCDLENAPFEIEKVYGDLPVKFREVEDEVARLEIAVKAAEARQKELKAGLYQLMEKHGVDKWEGAKIKLTRVLPTTSTTFDSKALKADHPDIYEQYTKQTERAGSLRITLVK